MFLLAMHHSVLPSKEEFPNVLRGAHACHARYPRTCFITRIVMEAENIFVGAGGAAAVFHDGKVRVSLVTAVCSLCLSLLAHYQQFRLLWQQGNQRSISHTSTSPAAPQICTSAAPRTAPSVIMSGIMCAATS